MSLNRSHYERVWAVRLNENDDPDIVAAEDGFINLGRVMPFKNTFLFFPRKLVRRSHNIALHFKYLWAQQQVRRERFKRQFDDPLWPLQWYMNGNFTNNAEIATINVFPAWLKGLTGKGINIAIVDDGIQGDHPDISSQFNAKKSYNFLHNTHDVSPRVPEDNHGTRCAGQICSQPNNSLCAVGIAYDSTISGIKIIGDIFPTDAEEATALTHELDHHHIFSSSWGPKDDGATIDGPGVLASDALKHGVTFGREGLGALYVFASGNGGSSGDNCNFDGYANSPHTIAIGGITHEARLAYYSEPCAAHLAVTFGGGEHQQYIATIDIASRCTTLHTGTSAAAPIASAIFALLLQYRPDLHYRDIQHLVVRSTAINHKDDDDWKINGAGRLVNHKYGFGAIDAEKLINNAMTWRSVPVPQLILSVKQSTKPLKFKNKLKSSIFVTREKVPLNSLAFIEHVRVRVKITHQRRGALYIRLFGPPWISNNSIHEGTISDLATPRIKDINKNIDWTFSTVRHWDEEPWGEWKLEVEDTSLQGGVLDEWDLEFVGRCNDSYAKWVSGMDTVVGKFRSFKTCTFTTNTEINASDHKVTLGVVPASSILPMRPSNTHLVTTVYRYLSTFMTPIAKIAAMRSAKSVPSLGITACIIFIALGVAYGVRRWLSLRQKRKLYFRSSSLTELHNCSVNIDEGRRRGFVETESMVIPLILDAGFRVLPKRESPDLK